MGKRGPKHTPTFLKVLNGNPGKRPLNINEPKPKPIAAPAPTWMRTTAKTMHKTLAPQLEALGLLTAIDGAAFAAACESYATWVHCEKQLIRHGLTITLTKIDEDGKEFAYYTQARPEISIGNKALLAFKSFCTEFGLTPSSRAGITLPDAGENLDPMEALLRKNGGG